MKFTRRTARDHLLPLGLSVVLASCSTGLPESWGPPAGYTIVSGVATYRSGVPARGAEVTLTSCTQPIGGFLATTTTDNIGRFRILGALPPIGVFSAPPDDVHVSCAIAVSRVVLEIPPIVLRFGPDSLSAPHQEVNVTAP